MDLNIRVKHPDSLPFVGLFSDPVNVSNSHHPLTLQLEQERIEDDPNEEGPTKDADFYRQKAKRRRIFYNGKSMMKFEDSHPERTEGGPPVGIQFEGVPWVPTSVSVTGEVKAAENRAVHSKADEVSKAMSQYALLRVVKRPNKSTGKVDTEVDMVPLGGFYKFRKPAINTAQTLELVDDAFEEELARRKKVHAKYNAFVFKPPDEEEEEEAKAKRLTEAKKRDFNKGFKLGTGIGGEEAAEKIGKDGKFELPQVFGLALQARKYKKGGNTKQFLDECGIALDAEEAADETFKGDYEKSYANNDMAFADEGVDFAQAAEIGQYERDREKVDFVVEDDDDDGDDGDSLDLESDEDDEEEAGKKSKEPKASGLVEDQLLYEARNAGRALDVNVGKKRSRPAEDSTSGAVNNSNEESAADRGNQPKKAKTLNFSLSSNSDEDLTDSQVRDYVLRNGGRVSVEQLKGYFKRQVKAMNKRNAKSGVAAMSSIVKRVGSIQHDVLEGKVLVVRAGANAP